MYIIQTEIRIQQVATEYVMQDLMYTHSVLYSYRVIWQESCMGGIKAIEKVVIEGEVPA